MSENGFPARGRPCFRCIRNSNHCSRLARPLSYGSRKGGHQLTSLGSLSPRPPSRSERIVPGVHALDAKTFDALIRGLPAAASRRTALTTAVAMSFSLASTYLHPDLAT